MPPERLDDATIAERISQISDWEREGETIRRRIEFPDFLAAIDFIVRLAPLAESADHHPEIFNVYNRVELVLTTHDSGGITANDFELAAKIDAVV